MAKDKGKLNKDLGMFGLENKRGGEGDKGFVFELEKELKDTEKAKDLILHVDEQIQTIKGHLRSGEDKEVFEKLGVLLYGYASILKVIGRATVKKKS